MRYWKSIYKQADCRSHNELFVNHSTLMSVNEVYKLKRTDFVENVASNISPVLSFSGGAAGAREG